MLVNKIKTTTGLVLVLIASHSFAFDCDSQSNGNWYDPNTWINCNGTVPNNDDNVTIKNGNTVILDSTTSFLESLFVEVGGDLFIDMGTSGGVIINANNTTTSSIDVSNASLNLINDLTINANNKNILIGVVEGAFNLVLNSATETHLTNTIGANIPLTSLITDAEGTTHLADSNGDINIRSLYVNGIVEFNDVVILDEYTNIKCQNGNITFAKSVDSGQLNAGLAISQSTNTTINFNDKVGALSELYNLFIYNSNESTSNINTSEINTRGTQKWDSNVVLNSPTQEVLMSSSMDNNIRFGSSSRTFSIRSESANTNSLTVSTGGIVEIISNVGDNNQSLKNLTVNTPSSISLTKDIIRVGETLTLMGPVVLQNNYLLQGKNIDFQSTVDNGGFNLTIDTNYAFGASSISGVLSGSGDFIKKGDGEIDLASINSTTGNILINEGLIYTSNVSQNVIPSVPVISVAELGQFGLFSDDTDVFQLQEPQIIKGSGQLGAMLQTIVAPTGTTIEPGINLGQLTSVGNIYMQAGAQLNIELNGLIAGSEYDQLVVNNINLDADSNGGAILNLSLDNAFIPTIGDSFKIIDAGTLTGEFNNLTEGMHYSLNGYDMRISYIGGDGNDVVLTYVGLSNIYVNTNVANAGDGSSWANAFDNLQDALAAAVSGREIWVAQGVYYPDEGGAQTNDDRLATFTLIDGVSIYGGFDGTETAIAQRDPQINTTILSGDIDKNDINSDGNFIAESTADIQGINSLHIVMGGAVDINTKLDGFTITAGRANDNTNNIDNRGGGIFCGDSPTFGPSLNQMTFIANFATIYGAAIFGCSQNVTNSTFSNNYSNESGGSVYSRGGYFENIRFSGNVSSNNGGAMLNITNELIMKNIIFVANEGISGSGGALSSNSTITLENVLFSGNKAGNNTADNGGALNLYGGVDANLINTTFTGNRASDLGGALSMDATVTLNLVNSIIWNNQDSTSATPSSSIYVNGGTYTQAYSLVQNFGTTGTSNLDEDPLFVANTDPTTAPTSNGNAHLTELSMAIDTGDNSVVTSVTDLDNRDRIINTTVDMGAYEYRPEQLFKDGFE